MTHLADTALITGGGRGIGRAIALQLAQHGAHVAVAARSDAEHGLMFPAGHDADAVAGATGAFVNDEPRYLQSTGFVLDPAGRVVVSVYSSGAIGRLVPTMSSASSGTCATTRPKSRQHEPSGRA